MAATKPTEVSKYLSNMITYIKGDLEEFKQLCKRVEDKEKRNESSSKELIRDAPTFITSSRLDYTQAQEAKNNSIENSTKPSLIKQEKFFRITIPITITLFSVVDVLGFLIGSHSKECETDKNFRAFFSRSAITVDQEEIEILNFIYRQGLVHVYFPKLSAGISYHSNNEAYPLFYKTNSIELILNVNKLENIVITTLEEIYIRSINDQIMQKKYNSMIDKYKEKDECKIKRLSAKVTMIAPTLTTTTTTTQG